MVANWTRTDADNDTYALAASQQLDYLLNDAIRSPDGAISHRVEEVSLWYGELLGALDGIFTI